MFLYFYCTNCIRRADNNGFESFVSLPIRLTRIQSNSVDFHPPPQGAQPLRIVEEFFVRPPSYSKAYLASRLRHKEVLSVTILGCGAERYTEIKGPTGTSVAALKP